MKELLFGTAGIPSSTLKPSSENGVLQVKKLGLNAMEMGFVHGVKMTPEKAKLVGKNQKKTNIVLTAHAPFYVNLNAQEPQKRGASRSRILQTAKIADICNAYSITFHAGFYMRNDEKKVYKTIKEQLKKIIDEVKRKDYKVWIRPEISGKPSAFGNLQELIKLSQELDQVMPCIDFSHMYARTIGKYNSYKEFSSILEEMEKGLGKKALQEMHIHVSGIEYGPKGERNHVFLDECDLKYKELMKALKDFKCKGVVICESPDPQKDALLLQKTYNTL